jgi:hypothetical protein
MNTLCETRGFRAGAVRVPAFKLDQREWLVLRWPASFGTDSENALYEALCGVSHHPKFTLRSSASVATSFGKWAERSFRGCHTVSELLTAIGAEARKRLEPEIAPRRLPPDAPLNHLPATLRVLGGLMLSCSPGRIVVFNTSGLDPVGANKVYAYAAEQLVKGAAFIEVEFHGATESQVRPVPVLTVEARE